MLQHDDLARVCGRIATSNARSSCRKCPRQRPEPPARADGLPLLLPKRMARGFTPFTATPKRSIGPPPSKTLSMPSPPHQANLNLKEARVLRASGHSYRQIRRRLGLSAGQLGHIRRALKREKGACTRLRKVHGTSDSDLPIRQSVLPAGLRQLLTASGFQTLGDLADRLADPAFPGLETLPGIGPQRARLVKGMLDDFGLLPGPVDLRAEVEQLFPELRDPQVNSLDRGA